MPKPGAGHQAQLPGRTLPRKAPAGSSQPPAHRSLSRTLPAASARGARQLASSTRGRRRKPGTVATKEILKYQTSTQLLFRRLPFARLVREIMRRVGRQPLPGFVDEDIEYRISADALEALQTATEDFLSELFATSMLCATYANRVTLMAKDMNLVGRIRDREWDKILRR